MNTQDRIIDKRRTFKVILVSAVEYRRIVSEHDRLATLLDQREDLIDHLYEAVDARDARIAEPYTSHDPAAAGVDTDNGGSDRQVVGADHGDPEELLAALDEHEAVLDALYAAVNERDVRIAELEAILNRTDADVPPGR